jgi:peroxiredoxin
MFQVSCSGFHVPGFMFQVSCSRFHVPGFMFQVSCSRFHVPGFIFQVKGVVRVGIDKKRACRKLQTL